MSPTASTSIDTRLFAANGLLLEGSSGNGGRPLSVKEAKRQQQRQIQQERDARFTIKRPLSAAVPAFMKLGRSHHHSSTASSALLSNNNTSPMMIQAIHSQQQLPQFRPVSAPTTSITSNKHWSNARATSHHVDA